MKFEEEQNNLKNNFKNTIIIINKHIKVNRNYKFQKYIFPKNCQC